MDAALTLDFPYVQQKEIRIIDFTSNAVGVVKNIPWIFLAIIILPFYFILLPFFRPLYLGLTLKNSSKLTGRIRVIAM